MKKLIPIIFIAIFCLSFISALEWDNIKSYDEINKEVTISNSVLGIPFLPLGEIAKIKLLTPLDYHVGAGYQKVAEFEINSLVDYPTAIKEIELYNIKDGMKPTTRTIEFKYKSIQDVEVEDFENVCEEEIDPKNGTKIDVCTQRLKGTHIEQREVWTTKPTMDMGKERIVIGLFTDVQVGDKVEWIPTLFGVKINEWAVWTADLNVGLIAYYPFEETSGTMTQDLITGFNLTSGGTPGWNSSGKIGNCADLESGNSEYFVNNTADNKFNGTNDITLNVWIKAESNANYQQLIAKYSGASGQVSLRIMQDASAKWRFSSWRINNSDTTSTTSVNVGNWQMVTAITNSTGTSIWINGAIERYIPDVNPRAYLRDEPFYIGYGTAGGNEFYDGLIDELGIWNRSLSSAEITQLYNGGTGMTYIDVGGDNGPTVTLNSPTSDTTYLETTTVQFNFTAKDDRKVQNVSIYRNGTLNQTNTSGLNNTIYLFNLTFTDGTFPVWATVTDNNSVSSNSSIVNITVESTHPAITGNLTNNVSYVLGGNMTLNYNVSHSPNLTGVQAWYNYNGANVSLNTTLSQRNITTVAGQYTITLFANDSFGNYATPVVLTFVLDPTYPTIALNYPTALINYGSLNGTLQLNFTATDTNLDKVWYNYNGTNITTSATSGVPSLSNITLSTTKSVTIYANDTAGNLNTTSFSWDYNFFETSTTYNTSTYETANENYVLVFSSIVPVLSGVANIIYNGTSTASTISCVGLTCTVSSNLDIPLLSGVVAQNKSFYWQITTSDGTNSYNFDTTSHTQLVNPLNLTSCTSGNVSMNFTAYDEQTRVRLNPFEFQGNFEYYTGLGLIHKTLIISNTSAPYVALCTNVNTTYYIDSSITYLAPSYTTTGSSTTIGNATESTTTVNTSFNYPTRTYYYQKTPINQDTKNVSLLLLGSPYSTNFIFNVLDSALRPANNLLVEMQKCYDGLNIPSLNNITALISRTDVNGLTAGNLEIYVGKYQFFITNNSNVLLSVIPCATISPQSTPYTLTFKLGQAYQSPFTNVENLTDINASLVYNYTSHQVTLTYVDTSGIFVTSNLLVVKQNASGSYQQAICNTNNTLSAGIIICNITTAGNYAATAHIFRGDRILVDQITFIYETTSSQLGYFGVFLGMLLLIIGAFAFKFNELAGIWLEFVIILFCNFIGLIAFGNVFITAYFCLALIVSAVLER